MKYTACLQDVGREDLAPDGESAWWRSRFRLREARDAAGRPALEAEGGALHEVPAMLDAAKDAILTTGAPSGGRW